MASAVIVVCCLVDADSVRRKRRHTVKINDRTIDLEILRCPMSVYEKYYPGESESSHRAHSDFSYDSGDFFVLLDKPVVCNLSFL